jgi:Cft2 family RNA processing exonuclease
MRLTFHGAAGQVTGSCASVEHGGARILVDCGAFQGPARLTALNRRRFTFSPKKLEAVVLTHAHVDHIGRLPLLTAQGFRGPLYCTGGTADLLEIMLLDSARIHEREAEEQNSWRRRAGRPALKPLFTQADVARILERVQACAYGAPFPRGEERPARHLPGCRPHPGLGQRAPASRRRRHRTAHPVLRRHRTEGSAHRLRSRAGRRLRRAGHRVHLRRS